MGVESGAEEIGRNREDSVERLEIGGCELVGEGGENGGGTCAGGVGCEGGKGEIGTEGRSDGWRSRNRKVE